MLKGDVSRSGRAQIHMSASQRNLFFCFLFIGFFPLYLMHSNRVPVLQLFGDTMQPSDVGNRIREQQ